MVFHVQVAAPQLDDEKRGKRDENDSFAKLHMTFAKLHMRKRVNSLLKSWFPMTNLRFPNWMTKKRVKRNENHSFLQTAHDFPMCSLGNV